MKLIGILLVRTKQNESIEQLFSPVEKLVGDTQRAEEFPNSPSPVEWEKVYAQCQVPV
jgi:hypothetical protein